MKKTFASIIICSVLLLSLTFALDSVARTNTQREHVWLMQTLLPGAESFERVEYTGEDSAILSVHRSSVGYVIETTTQGYADRIVMLVGVDMSGNVTGVVTKESHETLGLGSGILYDHKFLSQFLAKSGTFVIGTQDKEDSFSSATDEPSTGGAEIYIDGISGATVSSKAAARAVSSAVAYVTGADAGSSATEWEG